MKDCTGPNPALAGENEQQLLSCFTFTDTK